MGDKAAAMSAPTEADLQLARDNCMKAYQLFMGAHGPAFLEQKHEEMIQYFQRDVVMVNTVDPLNPVADGGVHTIRGADQVKQQMREWARKTMVFEDMHVDHTIIGPSDTGSGVHIALMMRADTKNLTTGKSVKDYRVCHILHMVDGKIARFDDFFDPREMIKANQAN